MSNSRCEILLIDKKEKYSFLFNGFRKNKFYINQLKSISNLTETDLRYVNLFFVVLYDYRDVFELLKLKKFDTPIIIGSENSSILKKINEIDCFSVIDMSGGINLTMKLHSCIGQFFE